MNRLRWISLILLVALVAIVAHLRAADPDPEEPTKKPPASVTDPEEPGDEPSTSVVRDKGKGKGKKFEKEKEPEPPPLPDDKRLLSLHLEFVKKAEKLATEYEHNKQSDKAAAVYQEILKLVPAYPKAKQALDAYRLKESSSDHKVFVVKADQDWQDSGVRLIAGKPIRIVASGTWTLNMASKLTADGLEVSKEAKEFNLGSLIGLVVTGGDIKKAKPFHIGADARLIAEQSGALLVKMFDNDNADNEGSLRLEFTGRFDTKPGGSASNK